MARSAREAGALDWFTRPSATSAGLLNLAYNALDRHVVRGLADEAALLHPFAPARTRSFYSYADLLEQVGQLGGGFRELGVTPGRTVVLALPLGPELVVGLLACARLGAVAVPLVDDAPGAVRRLGHDPAVDRPAVVVVDGPRRAAVDAVLAAAGRVGDYEVVLRPEPGTVDAAAETFDLAVLMRPGSFQPAACAELAPGSPFLVRLGPGDEAGATTTYDQAWAKDLADQAVAAGWAPGTYVGPADDPTAAAAPYGALLGPLLVGATVELALMPGATVEMPGAAEPPARLLTEAACADLTAAFAEHRYEVDAVVAAIGESAHAALGRNATVPARLALAGRDDALATLTRLWLLQDRVPRGDVDRALGGLVPALVDAGVLDADDDSATALLDVRPYASDDGASGWIASDLTPGLDTRVTPMRPDFVLGVSSASSTLAQMTVRRPVGRALDLGTGCGVQSLHLARHAREVVATDLNPRALTLARLTADLNGVEVDLRHGDLYAPVAAERFDLIVTNPPYVLSPPTGERLTYREGTRTSDGLVEAVVRQGVEHLADGGVLHVLANWAHVRGEDWRDRVAGWVPDGFDLHAVEREVLDPYAYVELWLADAGLTGASDYAERYAAWCAYFDALGIEAVGMGWLLARKPGAPGPAHRTLEAWPYAVEQPVAPAFARELDVVDRWRSRTADEVLDTAWTLAPDVVEETVGPPGANDPATIVLRQQRGLRRAVAVDTASAGVLGACDGELSLRTLVETVAGLLEADPGPLAVQLVGRVRTLAVDGMLTAE